MANNINHSLWVEKYRPQTIDDCILPSETTKIFKDFIANGDIPNLLLTGPAGSGKTTTAKALCRELNLEFLLINGSEEGNIDMLRTTIKGFASTVSLNDNLKVVILDEADYLNPQSTMPALRGFIEQYADNCRFILTCNYENKIIDPLHSRLVRVGFDLPAKEKPAIASQLFNRVKNILTEEKVTFDKEAVVNLVKKYFPDFRKIINELQRYSSSGTIDAGILVNLEEQNVDTLISHLKVKDFTKMRKWVGENSDVDLTALSRNIFDRSKDKVQDVSVPGMILILNEYLYKNAFVADREINMVAMLTELMSEVEFK